MSSYTSSQSTHELLTTLFRNIALNHFSDLGTQQTLLLHILTTAIEDPKTLAADVASAITGSSKLFSAKEDEDKLTKKSQLLFLTLENIVFNVYSKLKTNETVKLQDSLYHTQASISYSILNLDSSKQVLHHTKFTTFLQNLLANQNLYEDLLNAIPKTTKPQNSQLIGMQVKNLISTFDYILDKENIKSDVFANKRNKFVQIMKSAPEKPPVKDSLKSINKAVFSGNIPKLVRLISMQKDRQSFQMSLLRLFHYYRRSISNPKYFDSSAVNGQEIIQRCITHYVNSKANGSKDYLFRENRSTEPLLDFIISYMTFYFLPVLRSFDDFIERYLVPCANMDASDFYNNFVIQGLQQAKTVLESLPIEFKDFLKKVYNAINTAGFNDKLASSAPVKTLIFHRFFFNYEIRGLLHKSGASSTNKQDPADFLKAGNYFKDLFYEASLKKYSFIPEFVQAYNQLNGLFEDILTKRKAFKGEFQVPNYLRFYVTKPLLRYDYAVVKPAVDQETGAGAAQDEYSEDFEVNDFSDEKPQKEVYNPSSNDKKQTSSSPHDAKTSNRALKKIMDGDDFSGSLDDDDFIHVQTKGGREEAKDHHGEHHVQQQWQPESAAFGRSHGSDFHGSEQEIGSDEDEAYYAPKTKQTKEQKLQQSQQKAVHHDERREQEVSRRNDRTQTEGRGDESWVEKFERDSERKMKTLEKEHDKEKTILRNQLGMLEEKYAMVLETLKNVEKPQQGDKENRKEYDNREYTEKDRQARKEDQTFYQLHKEIMEDREKALQAEVDYVMHKRINFLGGK